MTTTAHEEASPEFQLTGAGVRLSAALASADVPGVEIHRGLAHWPMRIVAPFTIEQANALTRVLITTDEQYTERATLYAVLSSRPGVDAVITDAPDAGEGWKLVYLYPYGADRRETQWSTHVHPRDVALFAHLPEVPTDHELAQWDHHSSGEKIRSMQQYVAQAAAEQRAA